MRYQIQGDMHSSVNAILFSCMVLLPMVSGIFRLEDESSSFVSRKEHSCLQGHVIQRKKATSFGTCAQLCLVNTKCKSVNYKSTGACELNDVSPEQGGNMLGHVIPKDQVTLGWWISYPTKKYVFTSLNGQGATGPTSIDGYNQTNLEGNVQIVSGIQYWQAPESGNYVIEVVGASGSNGTCSAASGCTGWSLGGNAAKVTGSFPLKKGTPLKIIVGQQGKRSLDTAKSPGGGGGGTFFSLADNTPLVIAGGGGGGGITLSGRLDGDPGQITTNGSRYGGVDGSGGKRYDSITKTFPQKFPHYNFGGSGAGFFEEGDSAGGTAAKSFITGGGGGKGNAEGGFGGGGFPMGDCPGGGGGYSGGGVILNKNTGGIAGGGGSFNGGSEQSSESGVNTGDGRVTIIISN